GPCPLMVALSSTPFFAGTVTARAAFAAAWCAGVSAAWGDERFWAARGGRIKEIAKEVALIDRSFGIVLKKSLRCHPRGLFAVRGCSLECRLSSPAGYNADWSKA